MDSRGMLGAATAVLMCGVLASCGAQDQEAAAADGAPSTLNVGLLANAETTAIRLGDAEGLFEDEGLALKITDTQSGAAAITALISGQFDIVFANSVSVMQGRDQGLPLVMVAAASTSTGTAGADFSTLMVASDSDYQSPADLAGKTVATNTVKNIGELTARITIANAGADEGTVDFVELPFDTMEQALESDQIDAAWMVEPFRTAALQNGLRELASNYVETDPNLTAAVYVTTEETIAEKPELIEAFVAAMTTAGDFADENPDAVRALIPQFTKVSPEVADAIAIPRFTAKISVESLNQLLPEMAKHELVGEDFDIDAVLY